MGNYISRFLTTEDYAEFIRTNRFTPNVSYDGTKVYFNGDTEERAEFDYRVGDIILAKSNKLTKCFYADYSPYNYTGYVPQGVVVAPASHMTDGYARVIALGGVSGNGLSCANDVKLMWSNIETDTSLPNLTVVPTWNNRNGATYGSNDFGYLPMDTQSARVCYCDSGSSYYSTASTVTKIPSPYLSDGSPNPQFRIFIDGGNACADFYGYNNASTIIRNEGTSNIAAAMCHFYGTNEIISGKWYLPACGEMAYVISRFGLINAAITAAGGTPLDDNMYYWTSSEINEGYAYTVHTDKGRVVKIKKNAEMSSRPYVRPMTRL